jgi:hypothetical protein
MILPGIMKKNSIGSAQETLGETLEQDGLAFVLSHFFVVKFFLMCVTVDPLTSELQCGTLKVAAEPMVVGFE